MPRHASDDAQWQAAIADFRRSGLTQPEFCRRRGLPLHTFRRRLYARPGTPSAPASAGPTTPASAPPDTQRFVPVTLAPGPSAAAMPDPLVLILDDRHRIAVAPGFDPEALLRLIDVVRGRP
jgi:hypothetical protein